MKKISLLLFLVTFFAASSCSQELRKADEVLKLKELSEIVVTPENGIRPASYTDLDLTTPYFKFEPIENPPYGSVKMQPRHGFSEGYSRLGMILSRVFDVPSYRIIGESALLSQTYEFAFVHTGEEDRFYENYRTQITEALPFKIHHTMQRVEKFELHISPEGHKMDVSEAGQMRMYGSGGNAEGVGVNMGNLADFLTRQKDREIINRTGLSESFDIDFSSSHIDNPEKFSADLEQQLGLILLPLEEEDWVLIVR